MASTPGFSKFEEQAAEAGRLAKAEWEGVELIQWGITPGPQPSYKPGRGELLLQLGYNV